MFEEENPQRSIFVGRTAELKVYKDLLEEFRTIQEQALINSRPNAISYLLDVFGVGGLGKSALLKEMYKSKANYFGNEYSAFRVYIDISNCNDEALALLLLRDAMGKSYDQLDFTQFDFVYELYFRPINEIIRLSNSKKDSVGSIIIKYLVNLTFDTVSNLDYCPTSSLSTILGTAFSRSIISLLPDFMRDIKAFKNTKIEKSELALMLKEIDIKYQSTFEKRIYLRKCFINTIKSMINDNIFVFFIDNFRYKAENYEFRRDHSWLTAQDGLVASIPAFWVVSGRDTCTDLFKSTNIEYHNIELKGLEYDHVVDYFETACSHNFHKDSKILSKMLVSSTIESINFSDEMDIAILEKALYLPIRMKLVAEHYNNILLRKRSVSEKDFSLIEGDEALCYYFEIDLSDIRLDVFNILSCLGSWDDTWMRIVNERFNIYLLNARNLLLTSSSIEELEYGVIKLHDVIREYLYKSSNNKIKYDIQEWCFLHFLQAQGVININDQQKNSPILDIKMLENYMFLCLEYLEGLKKRHRKYPVYSLEQAFDMFYQGFKKTYDVLSRAENITIDFINITRLVYLRCRSIFPLGDTRVAVCERDLANAYTNNSYNYMALKEDISALQIATDQCEKLKRNNKINDIDFIMARSSINASRNAVGWDYGHIWDYKQASYYCNESRNSQIQLINEAMPYLNLSEMETKCYRELLESLSCDLGENYKIYFQGNGVELAFPGLIECVNELKKSNSWTKIIDMLTVYFSSSGNIPWYYLRLDQNNSEDLKDFQHNFNPVSLGLHTYLLRKVIYGDTHERTLISLHNLSVYLFKTGKYEEAREIGMFAFETARKELRNVNNNKNRYEEKIDLLKSNDYYSLFTDDEFNDALRNYKDLLDTRGLAVEILQYLSSYTFYIAMRSKDIDVQQAGIKEALRMGNSVVIIRFISLNRGQTSLLDSLSYTASYLYALGRKDEAIDRSRFVINEATFYNNEKEKVVNDKKYLEYESILRLMEQEEWDEIKRI